MASVDLSEIHGFLGCATPPRWIENALAQQDVLLLDHKNCEWKAAATAFNLIARHGNRPELVSKLSRLAREELRHFEQVLGLLKKRGIPLTNLSASRYAAGLRELVRDQAIQKLTDTLVIGAFIEARSCERFAALVPHLDDELGKFYTSLLKSESRHFRDYLKLAYQYGDAADVDAMVGRVRQKEAELIQAPDTEFRFHSGPVAAE